MPVGEELQFAVELKSFVLPSLYVPFAANCCVRPSGIVGVAGVTVMALNATGGGPTVSVVEPVTAPETAEIVVIPCATDVANPNWTIVAMVVADESHTTDEVRFLVLPSL
jgi:hypothetical protein